MRKRKCTSQHECKVCEGLGNALSNNLAGVGEEMIMQAPE